MTRHALADSFNHALHHPETLFYGMLGVLVLVGFAYVKGRMDDKDGGNT